MLITQSNLVVIGLFYMAYPDDCQHRISFLPKLRPYPAKEALALVSHQCTLCCVQIEHDKASLELHYRPAVGVIRVI